VRRDHERRGAALRWSAGVAAAFAALVVLLSVVASLAYSGVENRARNSVLAGPTWLDGWFQYDAGWYVHIATVGYEYVPGQQSSIAFFPVYPLGVRALSEVFGDDVQLAGQVLAVLAGLLAVLVYALWVRARLPRRAAVIAVVVLLVYPYALFLYGPMYADSLFLLAAVGSFVLLERRWYLAAGLVGALATAGRPVGVAVAAGLVVRTLEMLAQDRRGDRYEALPVGAGAGRTWPGWREVVGAVRDVRGRHLLVLTSGLGLAAWCLYLWLEFGNPLAFVEVESAPGWNQGVGPHTWFKIGYLGTVLKGPYDVAVLLTLQALACLCAVLLLRRVQRLFGWGYAAYSAIVLLIPIVGTKDFMGTGRYVLVAFPVMAAAGHLLATARRRWLAVVVPAALAVLLVVLTTLFARGVAIS
jgi:hypothetical protein